MKLRYTSKFEKHFAKLSPRLKEKVVLTIDTFVKNPYNKILHNHSLSGKLADRRTISVTGNVRIIFREYDNYMLVIMLDGGTHNQIYN